MSEVAYPKEIHWGIGRNIWNVWPETSHQGFNILLCFSEQIYMLLRSATPKEINGSPLTRMPKSLQMD
jgi:hypothetical protein